MGLVEFEKKCALLTLMMFFRYCNPAATDQSAASLAAAGPGSPPHSSEYCNMETLRARCQQGDVIVMETALFGRMRVGRCITSDAYLTALQQLDPTSLGCSADVLSYLDRVCSGISACDVSVPNPELYAFQPCSAQLTMFLEASYSCLTVVEEDRSCQISAKVGSRLHIAGKHRSQVSDDSVRCGLRSHPWLLEAQTGQQINISLLDFSGHGQRTQPDRRGLVSDDCSSDDDRYGYIVDKTNKKNISICSTEVQRRHRHVYHSVGNVVEIVLSQLTADENTPPNFLLAFEAVGCSNLVPPSDAWLRRTDNEATIGCYTTRQRWNLRCNGNRWTGTVGVCTETVTSLAVSGQNLPVAESKDQHAFIQVLLIVSISFVGLAVCLIIIFVGIGCARRYTRDSGSLMTRPGNNVFTADQSMQRPLFYDENAAHSAMIRNGSVQS